VDTAAKEYFEWGLERFRDEARALIRIRNAAVVQALRFFTAHNTGYLVMDYVEGRSLSDVLVRSGTLGEKRIREITDELLNGLAAAHAAGYLHRDIKPSNIYLRAEDGQPVLLDFGAARQALGRETKTLSAIVTPGFSPPEQYGRGERQKESTDLYALGATLYFCAMGNAPPDATERIAALVAGEIDPLEPATRRGHGRYSQELLKAIDACLNIRDSERPQNVAAFRALLRGTNEVAHRPVKRTLTPEARSAQTLVAGEKRLPGTNKPTSKAIVTSAPPKDLAQGKAKPSIVGWAAVVFMVLAVVVFAVAILANDRTAQPRQDHSAQKQGNDSPRVTPPSAEEAPSVYSLRVPQESLKFRRESEGGIPVLVVSGEIVNQSDKPQRVAPMRILLLDKENRVLRTERVKIDDRTLDPGKRLPFQTSIPNPPPEAAAVRITFDVSAPP
jgi:serine/threonine protein kinase